MKPATLLPLTLLLAGCAAVGPDYAPPEAPETSAELFAGEGVEPDSLALWWRDFHDPLLAELIETGLRNAPSVDAAIARLRAQRATREGSEAGYWPSFAADGSYTWARGWGADHRHWHDDIGGSVNASWELDIFGGVRRSVEQALATEAGLAYTLQEVRVTLAADIATAYVNVRRYAAQVDIAEANLALQERNAEVIRKRVEIGELPRYDLVAALAQADTTRASIPSLREALLTAQLELDFLTGQAPYATQPRLAETQDTMDLPDLSPKLLPNELLRRRADIRVAEESVHAQTAAIGVAEADLYPRLTLGGSIGLSSPDLSPWSAYGQTASIGPSLSWNLFGFGRWRKRVEAEKETLKAVLAEYRQTVLQAYQEAETAWVACHREAERSNDLRSAERNNADALDIANRLYEGGEITVDDVLSRQQSLLSAQESIVSHRADLFTNAITLYRALGGGWSDRPPEDESADPVPEETPPPEDGQTAQVAQAPTPDQPAE